MNMFKACREKKKETYISSRHSGVFIANFEHTQHIHLVFYYEVSKRHSEGSHTSKMELFEKIINVLNTLTIFVKTRS